MKIGIYGRKFSAKFNSFFEGLVDILVDKKVEIFLYPSFAKFVTDSGLMKEDEIKVFGGDVPVSDLDFLISIGGDGTFLEAVPLVYSNRIPLIGVNSGRLGFLANISKENIQPAFDHITNKNYVIEERNLIEVDVVNNKLDFFPQALNEVTIQKTDSSLITINLYINDEFAATYWSDGLIIATPTGSTAYSLSVGGPLMTPDTQNFIISPIASHNLTVRPLVISNDVKLELEVIARNNEYLLSVDNRVKALTNCDKVLLKKADENLRMLNFADNTFYMTLRNMLMWSADKRN